MAELMPFAENIWTVSTPLRLAGSEFGTRMLEWDFDRRIVTHGTDITSGAKPLFRDATSDL